MIGLFLVIFAQAFYAIGGLIVRKYLGQYSPIIVNFIIILTSAVLSLPAFFFFSKMQIEIPSIKNIIPFVGVGILWLIIAQTLMTVGLQKSPSLTLASLMTLFYPLFSTILSVVILKEPVT